MNQWITAAEASKKIAPFIGLEPDDPRMFMYLSMAQKSAWKAGIYKGFMSEFKVNTYDYHGKKFLRCPYGYNILMGINLDGRPTLIREGYFNWHHNSQGTEPCQFKNYAMEYRESPTILPPDMLSDQRPFKLGIKARQPEADPDQPNIWLKSTVNGVDPNGEPIQVSVELQGCSMLLVCDQYWQSVSSIFKPVTEGPVDYYAVYDNNKTIQLASLQPFETRGLYRIYELPAMCHEPCVHALFKICEPTDIVHGSQHLIIDDLESLISLVMAMDQKFDKKQLEIGNAYNILGLTNLDAELQSTKAPTLKPVQVVGMGENINQLGDW